MIWSSIIAFIKAVFKSMVESKTTPSITSIPALIPADDDYLLPDEIVKLSKLQPFVAGKIKQLLITARKNNLHVGLFSGYRTFDEQKIEYAKGRDASGVILNKDAIVTYSKPGFSFHNYALAIDIVFKTDKGVWTWSDKMPWKQLGEIGEACGLTWGGKWSGILDVPHFQYTKGLKNIEEAFHVYQSGGLPEVWKKIV